ncbi:MAG: FAD-binding protein [Proteobacteria bacterium]|nr:FAD-binding protein [Pseudomonadota bacterium]
MKEIKTDVLVVGSGAAGIMAAVKAAQMGCQVVLASKVSHRAGNSALAGGAWLVPSTDFPPQEYFRLVMQAGKEVNDAKLVHILAGRGEPMIKALKGMGVPLERSGERYWTIKMERSGKIPGIVLMNALLGHIKHERIKPLSWLSIIELLRDEERVVGAIGVSKTDGPVVIDAKSVVLATGGGGAIYGRHDNHRRIIGDGYGLALAIGLSLRDMEFVQFYPLTLAEPHLPPIILYDVPKEVRAINAKGEDLFKKHSLQFDLNESIGEYRDQFTLILARETERGSVYLDCTRVPSQKWDMHPLNRFVKRSPDFRDRPFPIAPAVHFFMGGVEVDEDCKTAIPGLFAAGEVTGGVHGANRAGGNALTECSVFGQIAGQSAARYAQEAHRGKPDQQRVKDLFRWNDETPGARELFCEVQNVVWRHAGPIRNRESLVQGLSKISEMEKRLARLEAHGRSVESHEAKGSLLISKAIMTASLARQESRGALYREDFPRQDDNNWLTNIRLTLDPETNDLGISHRATL